MLHPSSRSWFSIWIFKGMVWIWCDSINSRGKSALESATSALGFFHFVNGFSDFIIDPSSVPAAEPTLESLPVTHADACGASRPEHGRFCTEAMLSDEKLDPKKLMQTLKQYGSSVVISTNAKHCRFHLHTDSPCDVFEAIKPFGRIHHPKIDDMLRQYQTINERKYPIALVADSNADLPLEFIESHQIHTIP